MINAQINATDESEQDRNPKLCLFTCEIVVCRFVYLDRFIGSVTPTESDPQKRVY
jgi:hypothetical protein